MEKIKFFSDSCCDICQEQVEKNDIAIIPIQITHGGRTFREYYDISIENYWKLLEESDDIPQTTQITPAQVLECYREAFDEGYTHMLGIIINGKGSGSLQSCMIAREMFYEEYGQSMRIELIDSEAYTFIYGRVLLEACAMRDKGDRFEDILQVTKARMRRSETILGVYTMRHLKKSGRISGAAAFVGEALGFKPILEAGKGDVPVIAKVRGEKNLVPKMLEIVGKRVVKPETQTAYLLHGDLPEKTLREVEKEILALGFADVKRNPIGAAVTTNIGTQVVAVLFYGEQRPVD